MAYLSSIPKSYKCHNCGATGVKLWRLYQTFLNHQKLFCLDCAEKDQKRKAEYRDGDVRCDIGWLVLAVPTQDGKTFWGYTSIPQEGVEWWKSLPDVK